MNDFPLNNSNASNCPWCNSDCMYLEVDDYLGFRIGADCDEHDKAFSSEENDTMGNDFGRTQWRSSRKKAIKAWNYDVENSVKVNHKNYW